MTKNEILNIEWHSTRLIVKALNKLSTIEKAAEELGISPRNIHRLMKIYDIKWKDTKTGYVLGRIPHYMTIVTNE